MDSMTFRSYGKVDELEQQAFRRKTRKRLAVIIISVIVLIAVIIGAVVGAVVPMRSTKSKDTAPTQTGSVAESIKAVCNVTQYPESCSSSLQSSYNNTSSNPDPEYLFLLSMELALSELTKLVSVPRKLHESSDSLVQLALRDCQTLIEDSVDEINGSISLMKVGQNEKILTTSKINDIRTKLSTAITDQETCLDGLTEVANHTIIYDEMRSATRKSSEYTSNSLAIVSNILTILHDLQIPLHRKLLGVDSDSDLDFYFPRWIHSGDGRLLAEGNPRPNLTVAQDGSGDCRSISEALNYVPKKSESRFVIYVKAGLYVENVVVDKPYWNVLMYGDGMYETIVSGSLNKIDGTPTFRTGSLIAAGRGFIAKEMGFINTAGPHKHQAVAMRSSSDHSVFYRCYFEAYQDTLYAHSNRQFYRECHITGTIDFIFGNAAVVFQDCKIQPRQPMPNQFVTITAQGKTDPNQHTGISIQGCEISPFDNLTATTYLGRPWKDYSTTIFIRSAIGGFVSPLGWIEWFQNVEPPSTIFYAEYENIGEGSEVKERVAWAGYRPKISSRQAARFNVEALIQGSEWLLEAGVTYDDNV